MGLLKMVCAKMDADAAPTSTPTADGNGEGGEGTGAGGGGGMSKRARFSAALADTLAVAYLQVRCVCLLVWG